nr:class I SAM-dependent RNA methyltransferase [Propionibacterium sp.]
MTTCNEVPFETGAGRRAPTGGVESNAVHDGDAPLRRPARTTDADAGPRVGDEVTVPIGPVAHGGHWVARHDGRVIFVRGALTGERVRVRITAVAARHLFGDAVEVLEPAGERVDPPCPIAARCGGCDFQHVAPDHQAELKRRVVAEQLRRLAGFEWAGDVESVPPLLGWRTRVRYHAGPEGWGMHPPRSHAVTPLPPQGCLIAGLGLGRPPAPPAPGVDQVRGVSAADGVRWLLGDEDAVVRERADGHDYEVRGDGFWQVPPPPRAADTLVDAVLAGLRPRAGERAFDLYCGVGLFAGALARRGVRVTGVEGDRAAVALARRNVPEARFHAGSVDRVLARLPDRVDLVVLDPPRAGAGARVLDAVLRRRPRAVAYVACDPAALGRDLGRARAQGWRVAGVRAFDLFGMTHHVECVAVLEAGPA